MSCLQWMITEAEKWWRSFPRESGNSRFLHADWCSHHLYPALSWWKGTARWVSTCTGITGTSFSNCNTCINKQRRNNEIRKPTTVLEYADIRVCVCVRVCNPGVGHSLGNSFCSPFAYSNWVYKWYSNVITQSSIFCSLVSCSFASSTQRRWLVTCCPVPRWPAMAVFAMIWPRWVQNMEFSTKAPTVLLIPPPWLELHAIPRQLIDDWIAPFWGSFRLSSDPSGPGTDHLVIFGTLSRMSAPR